MLCSDIVACVTQHKSYRPHKQLQSIQLKCMYRDWLWYFTSSLERLIKSCQLKFSLVEAYMILRRP